MKVLNSIISNVTVKSFFKSSFNKLKEFSMGLVMSSFVGNFAFAGGGLDSATSALTDFKTWLFTAVGIMAFIYLLYCVAMAFMERKSWGEVAMALVYCALAGGSVVGGTYLYQLFQ